ncbi:MAG TPA: phosphosulfolactate synthase [Symbiobacteriaceae bacterium]|nr:phosphosulfolactate synthase [Symbiobacteriaceae bacterium]
MLGDCLIIDKGLGFSQTGDLLELAADYTDYIKFTFSSAALYPPALLRAKIALIRSYGVIVYPGGTFFEVALTQDRVEQHFHRCPTMGVC